MLDVKESTTAHFIQDEHLLHPNFQLEFVLEQSIKSIKDKERYLVL